MPRAKKSPAYQWYPRDYMADPVVMGMTLEQEGAYRRLMDVCWLECGLPTDLDQLWAIAKAPSREHFELQIWNVVGRKFQLRKGKFQHKRLDRERAKQAKTRRVRQLAAEKRWVQEQSKCNANASRLQCLSSASSSATAVGKKIKAPARSRRPVENLLKLDEATFGLYTVIAKEARQLSNIEDHDDSFANVSERFKQLCALRRITYTSDLADRAINAAMRDRVSA